MNASLLIQLPINTLEPSTEVEWVLSEDGVLLEQDKTAIAELTERVAGLCDDYDVIVLAPAGAVLLTQVSIPSKQLRQIHQALPFMVEELIAEDIDNVHLAIPETLDTKSDTVPVAVVKHSLLIHWLDVLHSCSLSPAMVTADFLLLPWDENSWSLFCTDQQLFIRNDEYSGITAEIADAEIILDSLLSEWANQAEEPQVLPQLVLMSSATSTFATQKAQAIAQIINKKYDSFAVKEHVYQETLLELMSAESDQADDQINLLQGGYAVSQSAELSDPGWRLVASIAGIGLLAYLVLTLGSGWYFNYQAQQLEDNKYALYRQLFPNERRVVNPVRQMQNHLRSSGPAANSSFLSLLSETARQLSATGDENLLSFNQLRFNNSQGSLQFEVRSQSLDQLEQIKQQIGSGGLQVDINSATEQEESVIGRLVVRGS